MLRPRSARWFEVLCPRSDSARIIGSAETGSGVYLASDTPLVRHERDELSRVL